ncbi:polyprenyl synthetase family protein [Streptomyces fumanus]|uniref:Geranylgeranyl pyrophosphate synthase n=1 Tax=Streptomyces fumanus TaxID=67302 RepID=A0A919DYK3_9ACTN|nr:polyprenyl synthetase family protein [Streptomyces fumanus]GHE98545.1 geranylgeranyl pyrophosphate synthase [Streptomyces fumanus]
MCPVAPTAGLSGGEGEKRLDPDWVRSAVDAVLTAFLQARAGKEIEGSRHPDLGTPLLDFVQAGGKRLRPFLTMLGWHAVGARGTERAALYLAASLELFHVFALIHDDVMDGSETRRGHPSLHRAQGRRFASLLACAGHTRPVKDVTRRLGEGAAILIGDAALAWSEELFWRGDPAPEQCARVVPLLCRMRTELVHGQYLDLEASARAMVTVEEALTIARYKSAKYSVEHPLHLGAALGGATPQVLEALSAYALPAGEAFQLRDDLLGVYGDPRQTGKSALDDLREGKKTVLVCLARQAADAEQHRVLDTLLGRGDLDEEGADRLRAVLEDTGARMRTESMIADRARQAKAALRQLPANAAVRASLHTLITRLVQRDV